MQVIRSLKRALQPAVTDVSVEFKVPPVFEILQSPQKLPPIFDGEKLVVYSILTPSAPLVEEVNGTAILKGSILGAPLEHSVPFKLQPVESAEHGLPSVHHLAAKALITDWQDGGKSKESIVKLSIESSVISTHTAFIAVDEESSEPITRAMKTWDVDMAEMNEFSNLLSANTLCIDQAIQRGERLDSIEAECAELGDKSLSFNSAKKSGGFFSSLGSMFSGWQPFGSRSKKSSKMSASAQVTSMDLMADEPCESEVMMEGYLDNDSEEEEAAQMQPKAAPAPQGPNQAPLVNTLSSIITIQQANGSWKLDGTLAQLLSKTQKTLEENCPTECQGTMAAVWATVLVLTLLRMKYSSQQEEWELIAMKAET